MTISIYEMICPYCGGKLNKVPLSKTRCPNCYNYFYIRTTIDGGRFAVTENEKNKIDASRKRRGSGCDSNPGCGSNYLARSAVRGAARGCCLLSLINNFLLIIFIIFILSIITISY